MSPVNPVSPVRLVHPWVDFRVISSETNAHNHAFFNYHVCPSLFHDKKLISFQTPFEQKYRLITLGMLDIALLTTNASQLKYLLQARPGNCLKSFMNNLTRRAVLKVSGF